MMHKRCHNPNLVNNQFPRLTTKFPFQHEGKMHVSFVGEPIEGRDMDWIWMSANTFSDGL